MHTVDNFNTLCLAGCSYPITGNPSLMGEKKMDDESVLYDTPADKIVKKPRAENGPRLVNYDEKAKEKARKIVVDGNNELKIRFIHATRGGMPILTIETLTQLIDHLGVNVRYNVISKNVEINIPDEEYSLENAYSCSMTRLESHAASCQLPTHAIERMVGLYADNKRYNPIQEFILSNKWDGQDRLKALFDTIDAEDNTAKEAFLVRWMISAVAAAFEPNGIDARGMIVLQGAQHMGKTWWLRKLLPEGYLRDHYFKDSFLLDPHDKDKVKQCVSHWIVELGEIDSTFRKSDIGALKAFITSDKDTLRTPFSRREQSLPRRTVLAGSVNKIDYLIDETGNTRFWTIACKSINSYHDIDICQVWAQVYQLYKSGEKWALTTNELGIVNTINESHRTPDYIEEKIAIFYDWENGYLLEWKTATQIAEDIGLKNIIKSQLSQITKEVLKHNGGKFKRSNKYRLMQLPDRK